MKYILLLCISALNLRPVIAQTVADFENFNLAQDSFVNNAIDPVGFVSGDIILPNNYNAEWDAWTGWAISSATDSLTPGFLNQYSAITGGGVNGSDNYAITYAFDGSIVRLEEAAAGKTITGFYITNSTYAYLAMRDGDSFAKRFGGVTGDDPDFFLLKINKYINGNLASDSLLFYLADYRFADNAEDYIVQDWTFIDLAHFGPADSLLFTLTSSDIGQFGMNTPAYFCIDNVQTIGTTSTKDESMSAKLNIFPNPVTDYLNIVGQVSGNSEIEMRTLQGTLIKKSALGPEYSIWLGDISAGAYLLTVHGAENVDARIILKY